MKKLSPSWLFQFQQLLEIGSFTDTAQKLNLSQQSLSRNIHELESWAGQPLFLRLPGRLELTPGGQLLWQSLPELLQGLQKIYTPAPQERQRLNLGISAFWNQHYLSGCLKMLFERQPELNLQVSPLAEADILAFLLAGELDLGLTLNPPGKGFSQRALPEQEWLLVCRPELLEAAEPVPYLNCVSAEIPAPDCEPRRIPQLGEAIGKVNSLALLREFVLAGMAAGFLFGASLQQQLEQGQLIRLEVPALAPVRPYAVWLGDQQPASGLLELLSLLEQKMQQ